jgi:membrane fusion protein, multidrug efflux system
MRAQGSIWLARPTQSRRNHSASRNVLKFVNRWECVGAFQFCKVNMNRRNKCVNFPNFYSTERRCAEAMPVVVLALASLWALGCGTQQANPGQGQQTQQGAGASAQGAGRGPGRGAAVPVVAERAVLKNMPMEVSAIGTVEPYLSVAVRPQVTGPLLEARFKEGDFVHKDQVLFTIDPRPYEADLERNQAALLRDKALAENNRSQAERYKKLLAEGVAPAQQVDQFLSAADASDATVVADQAAIRTSQLNLDYCTITAPLDGYAGKLQIQPGNLVRVADSLVVINQVNPVYVTFSVPQQNLGDIKRYMASGKLQVTAAIPNDSGPAERGVLEFVDNAVDPTTGTIRLRAQFDNPGKRLWPGLFVNATLRLSERPNTLVVPTQAVSNNQTGQYVYVVKQDSTVESRPVVVGASVEGESVIQQGLKPGEMVVTDGQLRLVPGARAEITNRQSEDLPTPPGAGVSGRGAAGAAKAGSAGIDPQAGQGRGQGQGKGQDRSAAQAQ